MAIDTWEILPAGTSTGVRFGLSEVNAVKYGLDTWVAVGGNGKASYSSDGITWTALTPGASTGIKFGADSAISLVYGASTWVTGGVFGKASYSSDGINWTALTPGTTTGIKFDTVYNVNSIAYGGGIFVAVGSTGRASYSSDGINWTSLPNGASTGICFNSTTANCVAYGAGTWVVVGDSGKASYSSDGINWTALTPGISTGIKFSTDAVRSVAYNDGMWVAVGVNGKASYSSDGINWTALTPGTTTGIKFGGFGNTARSISFGGESWYGGGNWVVVGSGGKASYSSDGINWTALTPGTTTGIKFNTNTANFVSHGYDKWIVVGGSGKASYSITDIPIQTFIFDEGVVISDRDNLFRFTETVLINASAVPIVKIRYGSKIISVNPLIIVTDTDPVQLLKIDTSDLINLNYEQLFIDLPGETLRNAKDISYNPTTGLFYVVGTEGIISEIELDNIQNRQEIDLEDSNDLTNSKFLTSLQKLYIATDDSTGEIITLDRSLFSYIQTNISFMYEKSKIIRVQINTTDVKYINCDIRFVGEVSTIIKTDIRVLAVNNPYDAPYTPIKRTDFDVKIDDVSSTDVKLDSISIRHTVDAYSEATFILARQHDNLNYTLSNDYSEITNQNNVKIYIKNRLEFEGKISKLDANSESETVVVNCTGDKPETKRNTLLLPMPIIGNNLTPYDILLNSLSIDNPYIDPNEENPTFYKGVEVNLGTRRRQNVNRWWTWISISSTLSKIQDGTYSPPPNTNMFWYASVKNFITKSTTMQVYIGTSLAPLASDTYEILGVTPRYQRINEDSEEELGVYTVGEAPFRTISARSGEYITKDRWVDEAEGLYRNKPEGYNFTNYAVKVAQLEYEKLKNINGDILPITNANIELMIDGYHYYDINILTRLNIANNIDEDIYNKDNGFPVSVKSVVISSSNMRVSLTTDNRKSSVEIQEIDDQYPDEDAYITSEENVLEAHRYDLPSESEVG